MSQPEKKKPAKKTTARKPTSARKPRATKEKPVEKNWDYGNVWTPLNSGWNGLSQSYDSFGSQGVPGPAELIGAFSDTVYSCATMIADSLAEIDIRLVAETRAGQVSPAGPKLWKPAKHRSKAVELTEVHDNPALDLIYRPNDSLTYADLIYATSLDLDILGRAFWLITDGVFGLPARIDVLPAQLVTTERDETGRVVGYQFGAKEHKNDAPTYTVDQVLAFRKNGQYDPQQEGVSPVRAVWQKIQLSGAELSSWEVLVKTMAHPSVLLSPKDPNAPMSPEAAERFVKEYQARLSRGNQGGPLLLNEALDLNVLSFPPKDQAGLALQDNLKTSICNAFKVPRTLLDQQDSNFAGAKTAERSYQLFCLKPRISYLLERITHRIVSRFDDRLFLEHADFVAKDEQADLQRQTLAVTVYTSGLATKNETRAALDLPPVANGEQFYTAPAPSPGFSLAVTTPEPVQPVEQKTAVPTTETEYDKYSLKPLAGVMQSWFDRQKQFVLDQAKTKSVKSKAWVDLSSFTDDMASDLRPVLAVFYEGAAKSMLHRLGLSDEIWKVTQPAIDKAVQRAALQLAESTNATTSLAVDEAREKLRQELTEGITSGDTVQELTKRVSNIFEKASQERSWMIADTERTRAIGVSEIEACKASGVVSKKVWLCDAQACDRCKALNGIEKELDEPFHIDHKGGPYSVTSSPPRHVGCRCSMQFRVTED